MGRSLFAALRNLVGAGITSREASIGAEEFLS
jgi:hypothetical protein